MNKTRYSATEFGQKEPMNFRPSGTLNSLVKFKDILVFANPKPKLSGAKKQANKQTKKH